MKHFKKILSRIGLMVLIVFASFGIALAGGAPIPILARKEDSSNIRIELLDNAEDEETDAEELIVE